MLKVSAATFLIIFTFLFPYPTKQENGEQVENTPTTYAWPNRTINLRVYVDSLDMPNMEKVKQVLDQAVFECKTEIDINVRILSIEPMTPVMSKDPIMIRGQANNDYPLRSNDCILFVTNSVAIIKLVVVTPDITDLSGWIKVAQTQAYGLCVRERKYMALHNFDQQNRLCNQGGYIIAPKCLGHEIGHLLGLEHSTSKESIMYPIADVSLGKWTQEDKDNLALLLRPQISFLE